MIVRALAKIQGVLLARLNACLVKASVFGNPPFFDPSLFHWVAPLERRWRVARRELEAILTHRDVLPSLHEISNDNFAISRDDQWKSYFLYCYGVRNARACERCPETAKLVEAIPGMRTAFFSIIGPNKRLPEHRGSFKGVLRCHLALAIPEPKRLCRIRVETEVVHWTEGKVLIFDDTYRHEVWNETHGDRVVLFLDVARPLRFPTNVLNKLIIWLVRFSPMVRNGMKRQAVWEDRLDERVARSRRT
jgi:aspartyl/asparaginyl beta-hydroxylase (cupin superfamily)